MSYRRGEHHQHAKLTVVSVREIRGTYLAHVPGRGIGSLATRYGVHPSTIRDVLSYRTWPDVHAPLPVRGRKVAGPVQASPGAGA